MILHFELDKKLNELGLLERKGKSDYHFIKDKNELVQDHLYYLFFRDKPEKFPSPGNEEENKKVRIHCIIYDLKHQAKI